MPFPSIGDLPDPRTEPRSPALQADSCVYNRVNIVYTDSCVYIERVEGRRWGTWWESWWVGCRCQQQHFCDHPLLSSCSLCRMEMGDKDKTGVADGPCYPRALDSKEEQKCLGKPLLSLIPSPHHLSSCESSRKWGV